jgi:hypothetical protein
MENHLHIMEIAALSKAALGVIGKGGRQLFLGGLTSGVDLGHSGVGDPFRMQGRACLLERPPMHQEENIPCLPG